jgi:hypothetical protein
MAEEKISYEVLPPEGSSNVGLKVYSILEDIISDKETRGLIKRWNRNYELKRGKHWKNKKANVPLITANLIHKHRMNTINSLTDNNPIFNVAKINDSEDIEQEVYENLQRTAEHWWNEQEQQDIFESSVNNGEDYGIAIEKVIFDPDIEEGGEVETIVVDPFHFGVYPVNWTNPRYLQKSLAVLHYYPISLNEARRRWPDKAALIKPDEDILKELGDDRKDINLSESVKGGLLTTFASTSTNLINFLKGNNDKASDGDNRVLLVEAWVRDYTMVEEQIIEQVQDESGVIAERITVTSRPKYPGNIRLVCVCNSGQLVLEDRPNPNINPQMPEEQAMKCYLWDKFPFSAANSIKDTASGWGISDLENLEDLNVEFNKALSQLVLMKDKVSRLKLINPKTSGVPNDALTNYPGILNPVNAQEGAGIRYLDYPRVPADLQNAIALFKDMFFLVSGSFDLDMAREPGRAVLAYKAIAALLERVNTMMRGKVRSYSRLIRERGRMYLSMVQNFYTEDRWITYRDTQGNDAYKKVNGQDFRIPFKLTVVTGSTMPVSKIQLREEAIALFTQGAIDQEELLDHLEWSGRSEVISRMKQGAIGQLTEKMMALGMPDQFAQYMNGLVGMKDTDFKRAIRDGQVPKFEEVMKAVQTGQPPPDPKEETEILLKQAEARAKMAEAGRMEAESQLAIEKAMTEKVKQQVSLAGIEYDAEQLKIDRAKVVADLQKEERENRSFGNRIRQERGMQSNNVGEE